jgi:hypothetical protein
MTCEAESAGQLVQRSECMAGFEGLCVLIIVDIFVIIFVLDIIVIIIIVIIITVTHNTIIPIQIRQRRNAEHMGSHSLKRKIRRVTAWCHACVRIAHYGRHRHHHCRLHCHINSTTTTTTTTTTTLTPPLGHEFTGTGIVDFSRWPSDW